MQVTALSSIKNSHVFLKVDFDVSINSGVPQSDYRIIRCLDTIKELQKNNNLIVLFTKIGRPENKDKNLSTINLLQTINHYIKDTMYLANIDELEAIIKSQKTGVYLYENTRFFKWEEDFSSPNVIKIASFFDYYVDESFATSHREESSNFAIPKIIKKISLGFNYKTELENLSKIRNSKIKHPSIFILGGAKAETKVPMVEKLINKFTYIIVGGKLSTENLMIITAKKHKNVLLLKNNSTGFDIDEKSRNVLCRSVSIAKTVVWNGPVGMFEDSNYIMGTKQLISTIEAKQEGFNIAGGGDTITAIEKFGNFNKYSFISTGGGAMFSFLAGNKTNIEKLIKE